MTLGFLNSNGLQSREGVVDGSSTRLDAGKALATAGGGVGTAVSELFSQPGVMNTIVGSYLSETVGVASAEQIGTAKVVNVGKTFLENIGSYRKIVVGDEFVIECGQSKLIMRKDGTVLTYGTNLTFPATEPVHVNGATIDLN